MHEVCILRQLVPREVAVRSSSSSSNNKMLTKRRTCCPLQWSAISKATTQHSPEPSLPHVVKVPVRNVGNAVERQVNLTASTNALRHGWHERRATKCDHSRTQGGHHQTGTQTALLQQRCLRGDPANRDAHSLELIVRRVVLPVTTAGGTAHTTTRSLQLACV